MDEFASWQDQRPEGGTAYTEDENLLQTLAETLPKDHGLNVFTVVASQKPMPRKFEGGRFRQFDLLRPSELGTSSSIEYAMVVASRVRHITEYRAPEIEEYHDHYRSRFEFARRLSADDFIAIFPMQPLSFDILRRITSNLTSARTGINVLWDVLGRGDTDQPEIHPSLGNTRRLIRASDLLDSDTLDQDLRQSVRYGSAYRAYRQAIEHVERMATRGRLFDEDLPMATAVVRTLFLWHCSRDGQINITLDEMVEAVLPEEGFLDSPQDTLLSVVGSMEDVSQVGYDSDTGELFFRAEIVAGRTGADVFEDYRGRFKDPGMVQVNWEQHLTNPSLSVGALSAVLGGLEPGILTTRTAIYKGINYSGEVLATTEWRDELGGPLPFDNHFRLVFMLSDHVAVTSDILEDDRILICVPGQLSTADREAITDVMALTAMYGDYRSRQDDEALRVNHFVESRRAELTTALLMAQWNFYKRGEMVCRWRNTIDPNDIFGVGSDLWGRVVAGLFEELFADRPIGSFSRNRSMNLNTEASRVFAGLWEREPERAVRNALENFAVGLGLTQRDNPLTYDPRGCGAFEIIQKMYDAAQVKGGRLHVNQIYERLASVGVPARLATLYLLCFVRSNTQVELLLNSNHRIRLTDGGQLPGKRIHSNLVPRLEWNNRAFASPNEFDALAERTGPIWDDCLEWTRRFTPDLAPSTDPMHVEQETGRLLSALKLERERLEMASEQVHALELQLSDKIPASIRESTALVHHLTKSSSFEGFMTAVDSSNLTGSDDLGRAVTGAHKLCLLGQAAIEIIPAFTYLNNVPVNRFEDDLAKLGRDRIGLIGDIDLKVLAEHPDRWSRIKERFEGWKRVYVREYRKFHRDFHVKTSGARLQLSETEEKLRVLENLEHLKRIGHANGVPQLSSEIGALRDGLIQCDPRVESADLEAMPYCIRCGVRMGDAPVHELCSIESQVSDVLNQFIATLRSDAIDKVLAGSESPILAGLRESLRRTDTSGVVNVLKDKGHVDLLRGVLEGEGEDLVIVRDISIVTRLSKEYPTVSQECVREVVDRFSELVEEELRTQQEYVGPNVRVEMRLH